MNERKKSDLLSITGLWKNQSKDGKIFLSGQLSRVVKVLVFANTNKKQDSNDPDYNLYFAPIDPQNKLKEESNDDIPF